MPCLSRFLFATADYTLMFVPLFLLLVPIITCRIDLVNLSDPYIRIYYFAFFARSNILFT